MRLKAKRSRDTRSRSLQFELQRGVLCALATMLTYWCVSGALFAYGGEPQRAIIIGVVAGLVGGLWVALGCAVGASIVGALTGPLSLWAPLQGSLGPWWVWMFLAGAVAAGTVLLRQWQPSSAAWAFWGVIALMIVNMWVTTFAVMSIERTDAAGKVYQPTYRQLVGDMEAAPPRTDEELFVWVVGKMRSGTGFYDAFAQARPATLPGTNGPTSVLNIREPLLYVLLAASPSGWLSVGVLLFIASLAALGVVPLVRDVVRLPLALPGVAAVLSYAVIVINDMPLYTEVWAGLLCLISVALGAMSYRHRHWRLLVLASATVALTAFLVREIAGLALAVGLLAAWFADKEQSAFRLRVWAGALVVAIAAFAAHAIAAQHHLVQPNPALLQEQFGFLRGGLGFAVDGLVHEAKAFYLAVGPANVLPYVLAILGIAGAWMIPARETRIAALGIIVAVFVLGLFVGNHARTVEGNINYWGVISQFVLYAAIPLAFAAVPAARSGGRPGGTHTAAIGGAR